MATCGVTHRTSIEHEGRSRHLQYRLPAIACTSTTTVYVPILMLVHCFGGSARGEMAKFAAHAERAGFAVLAPEGLWKSWNTPSCCGQARAAGLDDFGFLDAAVEHVVATLPPLSQSISHGLFASGFSNGGFVTSLLPSRSRLHWRGLAPAAGHEYEAASTRPVPISIFHCEDDSAVRFDGCCASNTCCCSIGSERAACVGTRSLYGRWLQTNRCRGVQTQPGPGGAVCEVGMGCAANTSLCVFPPSTACSHSAWVNNFPAADAVVAFFARQVCESPHGVILGETSVAGVRYGSSQGWIAARDAACTYAHPPSTPS